MIPASEEFDVVVVGGGGAGLAGAVSAAERGMRVLLLEKQATLGGTTRLAVGSFTAAGTRLQRRAKIHDSPDEFLEDMMRFAPELAERDNATLRAMLAAEAGVTLTWLEEHGVVFVGPFPEPPHRVNRMHNVVPNSGSYIAVLARAARRLGVVVRLDAALRGLVREDGHVTGVVYGSPDSPETSVRARRGVILAAGDFAGNRRLREQYLDPTTVPAIPINPHSSGDGQRLAAEVGAAQRNMDAIFGPQLRFPAAKGRPLTDRLPSWRWLNQLGGTFMTKAPPQVLRRFVTSLLVAHMNPSEQLFDEGAILVDLDGHRVDGKPLAAGLTARREASGYIVLDSRIRDQFSTFPFFISTAPGIAYAYWDDYARGRPELVHEAGTLDGLAHSIGATEEHLRAAAESLTSPPFFALGPVSAMLTVTEGGLAADAGCRVLDQDGQPIGGLYAAGGTGQGGMLLKGHGLHIAWALTSGRVAGESASRREPWTSPTR